MDGVVRVAVIGGLGLVLGGCPNTSDLVDFTTTVATDPIPPNTTANPDDPNDDLPGQLFGLCGSDIDCQDGVCVSPIDLGIDIDVGTGGQLPPDQPYETGGVFPGAGLDDLGQIRGICLWGCATVFECPQDWTCDPLIGACVPEVLPPVY
jgi:hypothetical protein